MVLQNFIVPDGQQETALFYRMNTAAETDSGILTFPAITRISTDTYMNVFDITAWKKYTGLKQIAMKIGISGKCTVKLFVEVPKQKRCMSEQRIDTDQSKLQVIHWELPENIKEGLLYFEIEAAEAFYLHEAVIFTEEKVRQDVLLSLIICTYKRQRELESTIHILQEESEFRKKRWLDVTIVDNASELSDGYGEWFHVYHNRNTGGAGGFARGMEEVTNHLALFPATHVILMDDDAILNPETLFRLRALLSYLKPEYQNEAVAGRMFRLEQPNIQYTAAEIWNGGNLRHIGWNTDMAQKTALWTMNDNGGAMYGGWWFECYPMTFVKDNRPLPFFIHCDDVEYGLRHGGEPIVLNGIQIWHESFENRRNPVIVYYDVRNSLIVNSIFEKEGVQAQVWELWRKRLKWTFTRRQYAEDYMTLCGIRDYLNGYAWMERIDAEENHKRLCGINKFSGIRNLSLCMVIFMKIWCCYIKQLLLIEKRQ